MDSAIALLGMMFLMFLVLSAAVEVILEVFRGAFERFGISWAKSNVSLDTALELAKEFAPDNTSLNTKIEAVKSVADQLGDKLQDKIDKLKQIEEDLKEAGSDLNQAAGQLNAIAASVKTSLDANNRLRVFIIRCVAAIIGCFLAWQSEFYVFKMLASDPGSKEWIGMLARLNQPWINILVGGCAAAAGSSYWHDQLDKIRRLKSAVGNIKALK